jgi:putative aldouronate transport system substrate-binding protein
MAVKPVRQEFGGMKMKKITKVALLLLFTVTVFSLVMCGRTTPVTQSAGSASDPNVSARGQVPIAKEKITMTVGVQHHARIEDYNSNTFTKLIEDELNIKLEFDVYPGGGQAAGDKIRLMVSSGEPLPDIWLGFNLNGVISDVALWQFAQAGALMPLNKYYESQAFWLNSGFKEIMEDIGMDMMKLIKSPDGNIYTIPFYYYQIPNMYTGPAWIRSDWLKELGLEVPTTTSEFRNVLLAFKQRDPNHTGRDDVIPLVGGTAWKQRAVSWLMGSFIYDNYHNRISVINGKVDLSFYHPEWREGLKYANQLYKDGLLSSLSFTQDGDSYRALVDSGVVGVGVAGGYIPSSPSGNYRWSYDLLLPLKGPAGVRLSHLDPPGIEHGYVLTKDCRYPEAAFKLGDWLWSEKGTLSGLYGTEGVNWRRPNPGEILENPYPTLIPEVTRVIINMPQLQNVAWLRGSSWYLPARIADGISRNPNSPEQFQPIHLLGDFLPPGFQMVPKFVFTDEEATTAGEIRSAIEAYVNQAQALFTVGDLDINNNRDWEMYLRELDQIGLQQYLKILQDSYARMSR